MIEQEKRDIENIKKIANYCDQVSKTILFFGDDLNTFSNDEIYLNAVSMPIMQIGELAKHLSDEFTAAHAGIPWHIIRAMRNWFAHAYSEMDPARIWDTAKNDIPALRKFCEEILSAENEP